MAGLTAGRYAPRMSVTVGILRELECRRLRGLVDADESVLEALHDPEFVLVHPGGGVWSRAFYLGGVLSGEIDYRRFEPDSEIDVRVDGGLAVVRYRSVIDIQVRGQQGGTLACWHMDCYRYGPTWRVLWSQATEIPPDSNEPGPDHQERG
ncbi:hypothetical protein Ari01nite_47160 [Paractinoplanes rishiriensis]|uniref:DUF4440 domain-containing protein n=2 Tax=Paractinoplanes rishiriensis TaxID=1050105 RepID=A0A919MRI8_9ACTN|nr:hypothetical protein Ari01nite_47160 [Actinoplanes rishiriensis]